MSVPFHVLQVGEKEYKLKFSAAAAVETEKRLKFSLMDVLSKIDSVTVQIAVLHGALQKYQHDITYSMAENIYEEYLDSGKTVFDFAEVIMEVYAVSGFMKKEQLQRVTEVMENINSAT